MLPGLPHEEHMYTTPSAGPPLLNDLRAIARGMTAEDILSTLQSTDEYSFTRWMRAEFIQAGRGDVPDRELKNFYQLAVHALLSRLDELRAPERCDA